MSAVTQDLLAPEPPVIENASLELRVHSVTLQADQVVSLELVDAHGGPLPSWTPGAHIDVILPSGLVRQYSLCGDPKDRSRYRIAVLRERSGRGGSAEIHDTAMVGRVLEARGPRNHFELQDHPRYVFVAGGIGITPILPMVRQATRAGRDLTVVYGGRTLSSMAFVDELLDAAGGRVTLVPQDESGLIDLPAVLAGAGPETAVYCCGPETLLTAVREACDGMEAVTSVHFERFTAAPDAPSPEPSDDAHAFEVELRRTGCAFVVGPDDSLIDLVREYCPDVMTSCEEGFCGTCETRVLEGEPEHHDTILTEKDRAANKTMMICVGRAKSERLVLDL